MNGLARPLLVLVLAFAGAGAATWAVGNLTGGVAIQTLVLVVLDAAAGPRRPLSFLVGSLVPVIEALTVVVVLAKVLGGAALKSSANLFGASPTTRPASRIGPTRTAAPRPPGYSPSSSPGPL